MISAGLMNFRIHLLLGIILFLCPALGMGREALPADQIKAVDAARSFLEQHGAKVEGLQYRIDARGAEWGYFCKANKQYCVDWVNPKIRGRSFWAIRFFPQDTDTYTVGEIFWVLVDKKDFSVLYWMPLK